jgi:predicted N-acetyltransferase YhbS
VDGPRALKPEELPALVALCNGVFRAGGGDMGREFAYYLNKDNAPRLRVCADGGALLAHCGYRKFDALVFGARVSVGCIGAVCTRADAQGKGLGTKLLYDCLSTMRAEGVDFAMISGGRGLYTRNGAVAAGRGREFVFRSGSAREWSSDVAAAPAVPADAPALAALYRAEPVRFVRAPAEWADIVAGRWCMNRPAKLLAIRRGGELVAYAAVRLPAMKDAPGATMLLGEFAGCRRSLAAALPALAAAGELESLAVHVASWDVGLGAELAARGLESKVVPGIGGTVKLVNLPQLLGRVAELMVERCGSRGARPSAKELGAGRAALCLDAECLELSEADAARAVFGTPERSEKAVLEGRGELGRLFGAALPLELPWYGYNYI